MSKPIRVLCVFATLDRGGAENMCMNLYRKIDRNIVQFDFVKHTASIGQFESEIMRLGGRIYTAPKYKGYNHIQYCLWWRKHLTEHPEHCILHGHFFTLSPIYFAVAKQCRRITIAHAHSSKADSIWKRILLSRIERYSDYAFACSEEAGKWLFPHMGYTVLRNAIEEAAFRYDPVVRQEYRKQMQLDDAFTVGTVANYSSVKNPMGLIEIIKILHCSNPNIKLIWAGSGALKKQITQKIDDEGLQNNILLLGTRDDVPKLMQTMDAFLLPSFFEGLPVVLIEAQAAGLPCFVSDTVTREADVTGLCEYLPLDQPELWAEKILSLSYERQDTSQLIRDAGYSIAQTAKQLQEFYCGILQDKN